MKKKKYIWLCLIVGFLISISGLSSQVQSADKVPAGRVAMHLIGWQYSTFFGEETELIGFLSFIEGYPGPFFDLLSELPYEEGFEIIIEGPEKKAFFTVRTREPLPEIEVGSFSHGDHPVAWAQYGSALLDVFFDRNPDTNKNQDICAPGTFSDGELIATFRTASTHIIYVPTGNYYYPNVVRAMMSAELDLESCKDFYDPSGKKYNFKDLVPDGVTFTLVASDFFSTCPELEKGTRMFGGSAIAMGGKIK